MFVQKITDLVHSNILRMKKYTSSETNVSYFIVNYLDEYKTVPEYAAYKSIILSADDNGEPDRILAFAPPHGIDYSEFKEATNFDMPDTIVANNAVEGTMIQLFYDWRIEQWNIATRGSIGGNNWFYSDESKHKKQSTFRSMFIDCLAGLDIQTAFADWPKTNSYCFVLQHPDNQIVFDIHRPVLHLVAAYNIAEEQSDNVLDYVSSVSIEELNALVSLTSGLSIVVPQPYTFSRSFSELECVFTDADNCMGVMFWNTKTGQRAHMENSKYTKLRDIRGNHPNMLYHFLELHKNNKAYEFLEMFPRYTQQFSAYFELVIQFSYMVYGAYVKYYIKHDRDQIPKEYFVHAAKIHHEIYVPNRIAGNRVNITPLVVRNYVENMDPIKLVYYLTKIRSADKEEEDDEEEEEEERALCN